MVIVFQLLISDHPLASHQITGNYAHGNYGRQNFHKQEVKSSVVKVTHHHHQITFQFQLLVVHRMTISFTKVAPPISIMSIHSSHSRNWSMKFDLIICITTISQNWTTVFELTINRFETIYIQYSAMAI